MAGVEVQKSNFAPEITSNSGKNVQVVSMVKASVRAAIIEEHVVEETERKNSFTVYTLEINKQACDAILACPDINFSCDPEGLCQSLFSQKTVA